MNVVIIDSPRSAVKNMALNEAYFRAVMAGQYSEVVRIYRFDRPGVILGGMQDAWDIRESALKSLEVTRRRTGGAAVYVDEHTVGYSLFGRFDGINPHVSIPITIPYKRMTDSVLAVLKSFGLDASLEKHWGIKVNGSVIAGHAKRYSRRTYEVHGLLRLRSWDMDVLERTLKLRKKGEHAGKEYLVIDNETYDLSGQKADVSHEHVRIAREEWAELRSAPAIENLGVGGDLFIQRLSAHLSGGAISYETPIGILEQAALFEQEYRELSQEAEYKRGLGHCFVDFGK